MTNSNPDAKTRQDIETLVEGMTPEDRKRLRGMPENDLINIHMGYGMWLRNQFRRNKFPHLFKYCRAMIPPEELSFDEISSIATREIWLHLQSTELG